MLERVCERAGWIHSTVLRHMYWHTLAPYISASVFAWVSDFVIISEHELKFIIMPDLFKRRVSLQKYHSISAGF